MIFRSREDPLEPLPRPGLPPVLGVARVVSGLVVVGVRVGASSGLENLVQEVVRELGLIAHPLVVPVNRGCGVPALLEPVPRAAPFVELVRALAALLFFAALALRHFLFSCSFHCGRASCR